MGNVRGAFFELESGLQILERGEKIICLDISIGGRQFDAMTESLLFECKNYRWERYIENPKLILELKSGLGQKKDIANLNEKVFVFHSKNPIPDELESLKMWLQKKSIELIEG